MYHISKLENGITVATAEMPHMASVSVGIWVGVGCRHEPVKLNGASHFIEHMLFKGTSARSAREISEDIEGVGGYLNAFTSEESTCFYARAGADRYGQMLEVLLDMFLDSKFAPVELTKERQVIKEEVAMYLDQPHQHVQELLSTALWPDHALGRPLTGTIQSLDGLGRKQLLGFKEEFYTSEAILVCVAGNIEHAAALAPIQRALRKFPHRKKPAFDPVPAPPAVPRVLLHSKKTEQTQMALGFLEFSRHDQRRYAGRLLSAMLGENMSSRLFQKIREDRGLAYAVSSSVSPYADTGVLNISAGLDADNLEKVLKLIFAECALFKSRLAGKKELERARDYVIGQMDLNLEGTENQMNWIGEQLLAHGQIWSAGQVREKFKAVTLRQVREAAQAIFTPTNAALALVSPIKKAPDMVKLSAKL